MSHIFIEGTDAQQQHFDHVTGQIPVTIVVSDGEVLDMFQDNTPLVCGVENPESCESCS